MELIPAVQKNEEFLADVSLHSADHDHVHIWWLGQSGCLISWNGVHVLTDPYLSDSLTKKYLTTGKPHTRMSEKVIAPDQLNFIDIVSSSHNHTDHLDGDTLIALLNVNPGIKMVIPEANRAFVSERIQMPFDFPIGLNDGESFEWGDVIFTGIPAAHNELERDELGRCKYMGYIIRMGGKTIYHSGDTLLYDGMAALLKPFQIDVAILPINGNDPARGVAGNLSIDEAIRLAISIEAKLLIPCHYNMFLFNTADPDEFIRKASSKGMPFKVLEHGERYTL